jgi:2Fe-2S ferredoxin
VELKGRKIRRVVEPVIGSSILELAERNRVDWLSNCRRGTCARCRCLVEEGMELLSGPSEAEKARLEREELEEGYRLGCQARLIRPGKVVVRHAPYF